MLYHKQQQAQVGLCFQLHKYKSSATPQLTPKSSTDSLQLSWGTKKANLDPFFPKNLFYNSTSLM